MAGKNNQQLKNNPKGINALNGFLSFIIPSRKRLGY